MAKKNVTMRQIAEEAGVSATTVYRVLNNREGCSEELREKILRIAKEEGYTPNLVASSMRKKPLNIALVFPGRLKSNRFFIQRMLDGYRKRQEELNQYNVMFQDYFVKDRKETPMVLRKIYRDQPVRVDGIVIFDIGVDMERDAMLNRLQGKGIPIVMLERAPNPEICDCCVGPNDRLAGAMAGELIKKLTVRSGKLLVINQKLGYPDPNGAAFVRELVQHPKPGLEPISLTLPLLEEPQTDSVRRALEQNPDIVSVYATCARHTLAVCNALRLLDRRLDAAIGSEIFDESAHGLDDGYLSAVIDKDPLTIGYQALNLLFDHLVTNSPLPKQYHVTPHIVLRTNKSVYQSY